jgi:hypothetical protein
MNQPITSSPPQRLRLRFFDLDAIIQSDSGAYVDLFAHMYRRFRIHRAPRPHRAPLPAQRSVEFTVLTSAGNRWGRPVMILDGEAWPLRDSRLLEGYTYEGVLNAIVASVRSHFLIHAGVVSWNGQGIILAADSSHGKTTLVLELIRRGFKFLSDEMAALGRADGWVHPFPRCLRIRPGTLERAGFPAAAAGAPEWLGKLLLDIEEIQPGSVGQAAPLDHVVILRDPAEVEGENPGRAQRELCILVDHLDDALLAAVRQIDGVGDVRPDVDRGYPALRLHSVGRSRMSVLLRIEALCQAQRVLVLDVVKRAEGRPTFGAPARLEAIPKSRAVMELLRRFQGGHKSALLQEEFSGNSARLFLELATLVGRAKCHQLFVGPLHEMADLVCGLVNPSAA